jgi:hypothetical protein
MTDSIRYKHASDDYREYCNRVRNEPDLWWPYKWKGMR